MAATSLLALLDDIATLLDDVSVMGKVAAKKTAGVLGDDLALNAKQVAGFKANRELPVVWAVFKGSLLNKIILVPLALIISSWVPWLITPLLMLGGTYLCYEGAEKVLDWIKPEPHKKSDAARAARLANLSSTEAQQYEKKKIKGAIRTDFILSAEIVTLTLAIVSSAPLVNQILVMAGIALIVTFAVYGLVGVIVKIDDAGALLAEKNNFLVKSTGNLLLYLAPRLMKGLTIVGSIAMFVVGGGIINHGFPTLSTMTMQLINKLPTFLHPPALAILAPMITGFIVGIALVAIVLLSRKFSVKSQ